MGCSRLSCGVQRACTGWLGACLGRAAPCMLCCGPPLHLLAAVYTTVVTQCSRKGDGGTARHVWCRRTVMDWAGACRCSEYAGRNAPCPRSHPYNPTIINEQRVFLLYSCCHTVLCSITRTVVRPVRAALLCSNPPTLGMPNSSASLKEPCALYHACGTVWVAVTRQ